MLAGARAHGACARRVRTTDLFVQALVARRNAGRRPRCARYKSEESSSSPRCVRPPRRAAARAAPRAPAAARSGAAHRRPRAQRPLTRHRAPLAPSPRAQLGVCDRVSASRGRRAARPSRRGGAAAARARARRARRRRASRRARAHAPTPPLPSAGPRHTRRRDVRVRAASRSRRRLRADQDVAAAAAAARAHVRGRVRLPPHGRAAHALVCRVLLHGAVLRARRRARRRARVCREFAVLRARAARALRAHAPSHPTPLLPPRRTRTRCS